MTDILQIETPEPPRQEARRFPLVFLVATSVIVVSLGFYFWPGARKSPPFTRVRAHLPFGAAEQAYARKIQLENIALSRAENFFHQEVTTLSGEVINAGSLSVRDVELTIEFSDELHQVVLRESRAVFGGIGVPLAPGSRREFEISFERLPSSWNGQSPVIRITGIRFALSKG